jgi:TRAP-type C4-dicarboxylate transport system substrate-binding protein
MSSLKRFVIVAAVASAVAPLAAAPLQVKLATLVPVTSLWEKALLEMGNTWKTDTEGRVTLTVYAGSTDTEATILAKMRPVVDNYQATYISNVGLADLDEAFNVLAMPFFLESDEEERAVKKALTPIFEQRLQAKGLHFLGWGAGGWVQLFSKKPLRTLADVKGAKLFTTKGAVKWVKWYVTNGFHPVELVPASVPEQLKLATGAIDTAPYVPYLAVLQRVYGDAPYMLDVRVAPLPGALIISNSAWNKLTPEDQGKVAAAARVLEDKVHAAIPKMDSDSIKAMQARGLQVIKADPKAAAEFRAAAAQLVQTMRGDMVPADVFDLAVKARDAARKAPGK